MTIQALYEQLQSASTTIYDYLLVSNSTEVWLEKKGGFCLFQLFKKIAGSSYAIEASSQKIIDIVVEKHDTDSIDSLEAINLSKICLTTKQIVAHVLEKRAPSTSPLQSIKKKLASLEIAFLIQAAAKENISPFLCACKHGLFFHALMFINDSTDLKTAEKYYAFLLDAAYQKNDHHLCFRLIELGANPGAIKTPIILLAAAIDEKALTAASLLINSKLDLDQPINDQGERVIHQACKQGLEGVVRALCEKKADINIQDREGNTPLHAASAMIDIEIALFLIKQGANCVTTNRKGIVPFSLPSLYSEPGLQERVKIFYATLFEEIPFAREKIPLNGLTNFISSCHNSPRNLIRNTIKTSPFEVPLLLQDEPLARALTREFSEKEFTFSLEKLRRKYPGTGMDLIEFGHLSLSLDHLNYQLPEIEIREPSEPIEICELLSLFDKITFEEKTSPYFLDPLSLQADIGHRSSLQLRELIKKITHRINNRIHFLGTPREATVAIETFYKTIENSFKTITLFFLQTPHDTHKAHLLVSFFAELLRTADLCGGRYFLTAVLEHNKICKGFSPSFEEEILLSLSEYRRLLLASCIDQEDKDNANKYGYILRNLGKELGIPEASIMASYIDQYGWVDKQQIKNRFFELYTPKNIQKEWIEPLLKDNEKLRSNFIDWIKNHIPTSWKKEIIEDRKHVYLATEVFDMSRGEIKPSAISYMLTNMNQPVFSSLFTI